MSFRRNVKKFVFHSVKHVRFCVSKKVYLEGILLHYFIQKKSAAKAYRILVGAYSDNVLPETICRDWFRHFKNNDFDVEDKDRSGAPKRFEEEELEALLHEDSCQVQVELAESLEVDHKTVSKRLKALGMIQKQGHWGRTSWSREMMNGFLLYSPNFV